MVKIIVFCTKIVIATVMAILFTSCDMHIDLGDGIDGNGDVRTEKRDVKGDFTKIEAKRGLNVEVEQSNSYFVEVEADENLLEHITTKVENGTLIITTDENIDEYEAKTIRVKMPTITSLETTSGASLTGQNTFLGANLNAKSSSGSEIDIEVEIDTIDCETSSGSSITIKGKSLTLTTSASSGSEIDARNLMANEITSESTSGSSTEVYPIEILKAKASSGGSINYIHSPKTITKEESSGGSISKE